MTRSDRGGGAIGEYIAQAGKWIIRQRHFCIAAIILAVTAAGWGVATEWLGVAVNKAAVPWPADVKVGQDFRLRSLPEQIGPYRLAFVFERDGQQFVTTEDTGEFADQELTEDVMESLGVGTGFDESRYPDRMSNWYIARTYYDSRLADQASPYRFWQVQVTYYTGGPNTVPHIPEVCMQASGAEQLTASNAAMHVPSVAAPWDQFQVRRTNYAVPQDNGTTKRSPQYYTFSLNGAPEWDWKKVRLKLSLPWGHYGYFAKIQFAPTGQIPEGADDEADQRAEEFLRHFLPEILKALPSEADVERLEAAAE